MAVGVLTAVTGARTPSVWFKVCLVVMAVSASLLLSRESRLTDGRSPGLDNAMRAVPQRLRPLSLR